jgi:hypothetical protein
MVRFVRSAGLHRLRALGQVDRFAFRRRGIPLMEDARDKNAVAKGKRRASIEMRLRTTSRE